MSVNSIGQAIRLVTIITMILNSTVKLIHMMYSEAI